MTIEARSLRKAVVPSNLIRNPSPASFQSNRLALHVSPDGSSCSIYIASGCHTHKLEISIEDSTLTRGKESLPIPMQAQVCDGRLILGTVDSYGHLFVSRLDTSSQDFDELIYSALPQDSGVGEGSWAGLSFSPSQWSTAAVARSFCKTVDIYDQDIHIKSLRTLWYPSSITFLQSSVPGNGNSLLAVAEGCQLLIWDLIMKENGGCAQRVCGSMGDIIYAVCSASTGHIAVGGADRTVTIYDSRRWSALSRWVNCSKYEITGLDFSSLDSKYVYIQGVDYEVLCGSWKDNEKLFSFRGDSNWLGFSKCSGRDVVGGWCDSGCIFVADAQAKDHEANMLDSN
ncbi:hypothetical protein ACHQM5_022206 [Ranunculus cassubicifolius]